MTGRGGGTGDGGAVEDARQGRGPDEGRLRDKASAQGGLLVFDQNNSSRFSIKIIVAG